MLLPPDQKRAKTIQSLNQYTSGGFTNLKTGAGTALDKTEGSFFKPTRFYYRSALEVLCVESWAARKFISLPVDDMFIRWRECTSDDDDANMAIEDAERELGGLTAIRNAMVAARQYGSGFVVPITTEAPLDTMLELDRIREGDLKAIHYFDRFDVSAYVRDHDLHSPTYGEPMYYDFHPDTGSVPVRVHASRVIRFDGQRPPTKSGFTFYDEDFGESELIPVIHDILRSEQTSSGIAHMVQEATVPVLHIEGLRETIAGMNPTDPTPEQIGAQINSMKGIYRILMLDATSREEFNRVNVAFAGLPDLLDRSYSTLSAAADIPQTRFLGNPPTGMNATGESDMRNYVSMLEARRAKLLHEPMWHYDNLMARHVGLKEPLEYEWESLIELSDKDKADTSKVKIEALVAAIGANVIDEDEARDALRGDWLFGELEGDAPEPDPEMMGLMGGGMPMPKPANAPAKKPPANANSPANKV